jgi:glycosyltransferase involved in cell wall biosynthesis
MSSKNKNGQSKKVLPMVSVCTPTYNRRPFIENMFQCFRNQDYPKHRIEWIIVDDGTDKIKDMIEKSNIPQIRYFEVEKKMTLGAKRNYMHKFARGSIIVYMDDDDYYPPERISHAVERLQSNTSALCAGSSEIYIYFKHINKMFQCGPYGPNHATAGTFAFRTELLKHTSYEEHAALAEEKAFLKNYTIPFVQLDPLKSILVFSHEHNTFDKRKMLDQPHPDFMKESTKTVDTFIRQKHEKPIKEFFMNHIGKLLENYEPGLPKMKPDVLVQIAEIEKEREKYIEEMKKTMFAPIVIQRPGEEPIQLSQQDVVNIMQQQQNAINQLQQQIQMMQQQQQFQIPSIPQVQGQGQSHQSGVPENILQNNIFLQKRLQELENMIAILQKQLVEKTKIVKDVNSKTDDLKKQLADEKKKTKEANLQNDELKKQLVEEKKKSSSSSSSSSSDPSDTSKNVSWTKIPIEVIEPEIPVIRNKSDPEIYIDIGE